jgi:hypothetical protein
LIGKEGIWSRKSGDLVVNGGVLGWFYSKNENLYTCRIGILIPKHHFYTQNHLKTPFWWSKKPF